ncbi:amidohydrolase family protein [Jatrophihabitans sp.]|uniref:amidohydrolase family protein n=1 Tax=Jatrophihabitans sp. TaxID=1932789 RepID=UPI0030C77A2A|nr:amidohydrolase 2 [Jatrophihabitans sp.]
MTQVTERASAAAARPGVGLIDLDVHNALTSAAELKKYLPSRWHRAYDEGSGIGSARWMQFGAARLGVFRGDAWPASGPPGSDLDLMREQLLDRYNVSRAVLHPVLETMSVSLDGDVGLAYAAAFNDWMADRWLDRDPRFLGGITVPIEDGERAAKEIDRVAADHRFAKIVLTVATREPLGAPRYWPILEAAERNGLPITLHVGGYGSATPSGAGWASFHVEAHTNWALPYAAQVVSLVASGAFDRFPNVQIILEEGSLGWMPALMWRMDRAHQVLGDRMAELSNVPSEIVRKHFWMTTQPLDEPPVRGQLVEMFDMLDMSDRFLFSSDYPHHDFDAPDRVLPASLVGQEFRAKVMGGNAATLIARALGGSASA